MSKLPAPLNNLPLPIIGSPLFIISIPNWLLRNAQPVSWDRCLR